MTHLEYRHNSLFLQIWLFNQLQVYARFISELYKYAMKKAAMIQHQVREPKTLSIKILSEFQHFGVFEPKPDGVLAKLFLYTKDAVFEGVLKRQAINSQLTWNQSSINTISDCLNGTRTGIEIRFDEFKGTTSLICEIESGIKVTLFEIILREMVDVNPLQHMKRLFLSYKQLYSEQQNKVKQQKQRVTKEVKQMQALAKRIEDQTQTEIIHMKKNFVEIINRCKKSLRKHMKTGICEILEEQEEQDDKIRKRNIVRVNPQALQRHASFAEMEIQSEPQHDLQSIFD